jgi:hypothetical protein
VGKALAPAIPGANPDVSQSQDQVLLRQVLLRPDHPVLKLLDGNSQTKITALQALKRLRSEHYEWSGTKHRVRHLRPTRKAAPWRRCYRTSEAPTLAAVD